MSYITEIKSVVDTALSELNDAKAAGKIQSNPVSEDAFLCRWVATSAKRQRFDPIVAKDLNSWVQQGRSMGKNANIKGQMQHIAAVYHDQFPEGDEHAPIMLSQFDDLLNTLEEDDWMVHTDQEISRKMRVISDGQHSFVANSAALEKSFNEDGELVKPLSVYIRGREPQFIEMFLAHGLLVTKVTDYKSIIKYHGEYKIWPRNQADSLVVLPESLRA